MHFKVESTSLDNVHLETVAAADIPLHKDLERNERIAALRAFIARLDALNRALLLLHLEEHSYAEIAAVLGISETNVATKLNRIKQKLRTQMEPWRSAELPDRKNSEADDSVRNFRQSSGEIHGTR